MQEQLKIDVVFQATSQHAHGVSEGIVNTLKKKKILGKIFRPCSNLDGKEPLYDDNLYTYLTNPASTALLFLGFDWHSKCLHTTNKWQDALINCPALTISYIHETLFNGAASEVEKRTGYFISSARVVDLIWNASPAEHEAINTLLQKHDIIKPVLSSNFGVDTDFFYEGRRLSERNGFAFFRGKSKAMDHPSQYKERRELISILKSKSPIDFMQYKPEDCCNMELAREYRSYKVCVDLPSIFNGPTTRVYEALSSGCIVLSKASNFTQDEADSLHPRLLTFNTSYDLVAIIDRLRLNNDFREFQLDTCRIRSEISLDRRCQGLISFIYQNSN